MFSRYIHERWQASHSSMISETRPSFFSHSSTSVRMPLTKREARMVCSETCGSGSGSGSGFRVLGLGLGLGF